MTYLTIAIFVEAALCVFLGSMYINLSLKYARLAGEYRAQRKLREAAEQMEQALIERLDRYYSSEVT